MCILSENRITLNGHNYEVVVSGVCLFVRPYAVNLPKVYHRIPSLQMCHKCSSVEGLPKKCCLYLSGAIWNRVWHPDIWLVKTFNSTFFCWTTPGGAIRRARYVSLFSVSHEPFSKLWYLFFYMPILSIFNWKSNTLLHHQVNGHILYSRLEIWINENVFDFLSSSMFLMGCRVTYLASVRKV